jgi:uncharacterized membrane protein
MLIALGSFFANLAGSVRAQDTPYEEYLEGKIIQIVELDQDFRLGETGSAEMFKILVTKGSLLGNEIEVEIIRYSEMQGDEQVYSIGDRVVILYQVVGEQENFYITDFVRRDILLWLFIAFAFVVIAVSRSWGIKALLGMAFSFFIIFKFILPAILAGYNPLVIAIIGAFIMSPVTFYLSHGVNRKTTIALISTFIALVITGILALVFVNWVRLTGFATEEAFFLRLQHGDDIDIRGILLAGIIIGTLGILDDVTVSQASIVKQLKKANPKLTFRDLYSSAMDVGHDHIASAVNTLVLVYAGAALPILLLFINSPVSVAQVLNYEMIADEVVRTLVGSIGLVLAVPITTVLAASFMGSDDEGESIYDQHCNHHH